MSRIFRRVLGKEYKEPHKYSNFSNTVKEKYKLFFDRDNKEGLDSLFKTFFPVINVKGKLEIQYITYEINNCGFSPDECILRGITYDFSLKVLFNFINTDTQVQQEKWIYFGSIPQITEDSLFIVNGIKRVVVSQIQKSPGVTFDKELDELTKTNNYTAKIMPFIGSWLTFFINRLGVLVSIDNRKKFLVSIFLLCFPKNELEDSTIYDYGYTREEILDKFYEKQYLYENEDYFYTNYFNGINQKINIYSKDKELLFSKGQIVDYYEGDVYIKKEDIDKLYLGENLYNLETGEIYFEVGIGLTTSIIKKAKELNKDKLYIYKTDTSTYLIDSFKNTTISNREEALEYFSGNLKIGDHHDIKNVSALFNARFFIPEYYFFSKIGIKRIMEVLNIHKKKDHLEINEVIETIKRLCLINEGKTVFVDKDHLSNKIVRLPHNMVELYFRSGLSKMARGLKEKYILETLDKMPLVMGAKSVTKVVFELFLSSLSQLVDDTNSFAEENHKKKTSVSGKGGFTNKENIPDKVRQVPQGSEFKLCGIYTSDGQNVGLNNFPTKNATVNEGGELTAPYHLVVNGEAEKGKQSTFPRLT